MKRRSFLSALAVASLVRTVRGAADSPRRVGILGHTGRGNYGHGLDVVWQKIPEAQIVAVADANEAGLAIELSKLGIDRGYTDFRKLLAEATPEFVSVAPRHVDQHHDMALAAIEAGVKGLYVEKPFCRNPAEADSLIAACERHGAKIAVAHRNRYHPALPRIEEMIADGKLGRLLELRGRGLGDHRGGSEDLWVLGSHIVNLIHHFAGKPTACSALVLQDGESVTAKDVHPGNEGLGPLAGNEVHARYETESGVVATYDSIADNGTEQSGYCLQLVGSLGIVAIHIDREPVAHFLPGNPYAIAKGAREWIPITSAGLGQKEPDPDRIASVRNHRLAVRDLIDAVDTNRPPVCDVHAAATTVEMICAVFASHARDGQSVDFPLQERRNALERL
jgi:predicted dehydrogenase